MSSPEDLRQLTAGTHGRYRRKTHEDWDMIVHNNKEVMVCTRKYSTNHGIVRLIDRSVDELKSEAKRIYGVLQENGMI